MFLAYISRSMTAVAATLLYSHFVGPKARSLDTNLVYIAHLSPPSPSSSFSSFRSSQ